VRSLPAHRPGNPDASRFGEIEHRHLTHVADGIRLAACIADCAAILQGDVVRTHPAVASPAVKAGDELVLTLVL